MAETMPNPFQNYEPPEPGSVFSESGNEAIVEFKLGIVADGIKKHLLNEDKLELFTSGKELTVAFNCAALDPYVRFSSPEAELKFVTDHVVRGVYAAFEERGIDDDEVRTLSGYSDEDEEENERRAAVVFQYLGSDEAGE